MDCDKDIAKPKIKSGAQKRKESEWKKAESVRNTKKIHAFFDLKAKTDNITETKVRRLDDVQPEGSSGDHEGNVTATEESERDVTSASDDSSQGELDLDDIDLVNETSATTNLVPYDDYFTGHVSEQNFWNFHPFQPREEIQFNPDVVYTRRDLSKNQVPRKWVTFNKSNKNIYCSFCIWYARGSERQNTMVKGCSDMRHLSTRLLEHEKSACHKNASEAYIMNSDSRYRIVEQSMGLRRKQVSERREVLKCIIDVIFYLGRQALAFRSHHSESIKSVFGGEDGDDDLNRGNFLELVKLVRCYNPNLNNHIQKLVEKSQSSKGTSGRGRGNLVSFLSKTTLNRLFKIIGNMIREQNVTEIKESGMWSVELDSTQDISAHDQCAVVGRYVCDGKVKEVLLRVVNVTNSKAIGLHELLKTSLTEIDLNLDHCISDAFDGAANMSGAYSGLQAILKQENPAHIHTWCYSHVLNLVITDASSVCVPAVTLFGLLSSCNNFFKDSYKRMREWESHMRRKTNQQKLMKLEQIGVTRWSSRARALRKVFGSFIDQDKQIFYDLLMILKNVSESLDFKPAVRHEARTMLDGLCKFETITTAFVYVRVFDITTPVSDYLQTSGIDILQAWRMVKSATDQLQAISRDFEKVYQTASKFVGTINEKLSESDDNGIFITGFVANRRIADPKKSFEINCHNKIMDQVISSIETRFTAHGDLYKELSCFDPARFREIKQNPSVIRFDSISKVLPEVDPIALKTELISLASNYDEMKKGICSEPTVNADVQDTEEDIFGLNSENESPCNSEEEDNKTITDQNQGKAKEQVCKNCFSCVLQLLQNLRLCNAAYENLYVVYKYLITLGVTQCTCERAFSKLKMIKTRLRSSLGQILLESLMLMAVERETAGVIMRKKKDDIINKLASSSEEFRSLLTL